MSELTAPWVTARQSHPKPHPERPHSVSSLMKRIAMSCTCAVVLMACSGAPAGSRPELVSTTQAQAAASGAGGPPDQTAALPSRSFTSTDGGFEISFASATDPKTSGWTTDSYAVTVIEAPIAKGRQVVRVFAATGEVPLAEVANSVKMAGSAWATEVRGSVADQKQITIAGKPATKFSVRRIDGVDRVAVVAVGAKRFEFVSTSTEDMLDLLVSSFRFTHPTSDTAGSFFAEAARRCIAASEHDAQLSAENTELVAQLTAQIDRRQADVTELRAFVAAPEEVSDAVAFIDALQRSIVAQREFRDALVAQDPRVSIVGEKLGRDLTFAADIALARGAVECG